MGQNTTPRTQKLLSLTIPIRATMRHAYHTIIHDSRKTFETYLSTMDLVKPELLWSWHDYRRSSQRHSTNTIGEHIPTDIITQPQWKIHILRALLPTTTQRAHNSTTHAPTRDRSDQENYLTSIRTTIPNISRRHATHIPLIVKKHSEKFAIMTPKCTKAIRNTISRPLVPSHSTSGETFCYVKLPSRSALPTTLA